MAKLNRLEAINALMEQKLSYQDDYECGWNDAIDFAIELVKHQNVDPQED